MNSILKILSLVIPIRVEVVKSKIQGDIIVEYYRGEYRVTVDSYWQSGSYARDVMRTALNGLSFSQKSITELLFLGIGPGSMVQTIRESFPIVHITGVDIDPAMLDIGRKYFHVQNDDHTSFIVSDACTFVKKLKKNKLFHVIVSDLFIGCDTGENLRSQEFVSGIYEHLAHGGIYISNSSYIAKYQQQTDEFISRIHDVFDSFEVISRYPNRIIRGFKR